MEGNDTRPNVYYIPHNFVETGTLFNGLVRIRNFFEGLILAVMPVPILIQFPNLSFTNRITLFVTVCGGLGLIGFLGIDGESLTQYLFNYIRFRRRRTTARYNPRVKHEAVPDYLENKDGNLPKDRILKMINSIRNRSIGESDEYGGISSDLFDKDTTFFFEDDVGVLEKPDELKTKAELKAEKKQRHSSRGARPKEKKRKRSSDTFPPARENRQKKVHRKVNVPEHHTQPMPLSVDLCIDSSQVPTATMPIEVVLPDQVLTFPTEYLATEVTLDVPAIQFLNDNSRIHTQSHKTAKHDFPFVTIHGLSENIITVSNIVTRGDNDKTKKEG